MIALADQFIGQYPTEKALVGAVIGKLMIEARARGWKGVVLLDADWTEEFGAPICAVQIGPGHGVVTIENVREFIRDKRKRAA